MIKAYEKGLWSLVWGRPWVDPNDLFSAIVKKVRNEEELDYRTRLLIRDGLDALRAHWGPARLSQLLAELPERRRLAEIEQESFDKVGFPSLRESLMEKTEPRVVEQFFHELSTHLRQPTRLAIGGSIALILPGLLERATTDIDVVDEVPAELRAQHRVLDDLRRRYQLMLAHFQRHYLPMGWENRLHYQGAYGLLQVYLVDAYDVSLSKLFSARTKDRDDLRVLTSQLDKDTLTQRLKDTTASMLAAEGLRQRAEQNWYILFGESLPA